MHYYNSYEWLKGFCNEFGKLLGMGEELNKVHVFDGLYGWFKEAQRIEQCMSDPKTQVLIDMLTGMRTDDIALMFKNSLILDDYFKKEKEEL